MDCPSPPSGPVKSGVFTYDNNELKAGGFSRATPEELKRFLKKGTTPRRGPATKPWITAQLRLYGIPFGARDKVAYLKDLLEAAVKNGQCNNPAPSVMELEKSLSFKYRLRQQAREEYIKRQREATFAELDSPSQEALYSPDLFVAKYFLTGPNGQPDRQKQKEALILDTLLGSHFETAVQKVPGLVAHVTTWLSVVGWDDVISRGVDDAFATLSAPGAKFDTPTSEANFDLDRFMAKYFLHGLHGKPAPEKTPDTVKLFPFLKERPRLEAMVASVPGLHIERATGIIKSDSPYTIIGWDINKIALHKKRLANERARKDAEEAAAKQAEKEEDWHKALEPHRTYMKSHRTSAGPLKLEDITGSYIIRCDEMDEYKREGEGLMTLDIQKPTSSHGTVTAFNLCLVEGTMLLALSSDALHSLREEQALHPSDPDDWEDESSVYDSRTGKLKASEPARGQAIKRRLGETPKPNRVYLQWAGREGDGPIVVDEDDGHTGYLDFDPSKAIARGEWVYPAFFRRDKKLGFTIYKRADEPLEDPRDFYFFSEKQYDYECRARWGGW